MNRIFKNVIAVLSAFAMTQGIAAGAEPAVTVDEETERYIPPHAQLIINYNDFGSIIGYHELMDSDNEIVAYCLDFENGYEIYDDYTVIEFSTENESPYIDSGDAYYGGPLNYYEKNGTEYVGIISNEELTQSDFSEMSDTFEEKSIEVEQNYDLEITESDLMSRALVPDIDVKLPGSTRLMNYNTDGSCGSLAATIMLFYYYDNINTNYLQNKYASSEVVLYVYLKNFIEIYDPSDSNHDEFIYSSSADTIVSGLKNAIPRICKSTSEIKKSAVYESSSSWGFMYYLINNQMPAILGLTKHPIYGEHWTVADGVYRLNSSSTGPINYYIVNDGWGRDNVKITQSYTDFYVYLN